MRIRYELPLIDKISNEILPCVNSGRGGQQKRGFVVCAFSNITTEIEGKQKAGPPTPPPLPLQLWLDKQSTTLDFLFSFDR